MDKSPSLPATPLASRILPFNLPSVSTSASSSSSSLSSSSSSTWPAKSRRSRLWIYRWVPSNVRSIVSKKQVAVIALMFLGLIFWAIPPPATWRRPTVHITVRESSPYQILRPALEAKPQRNSPDPIRWLEHNSNNRHAEIAGANPWLSVPALGHKNTKPRAALISLVRNSELPGLIQSMRQLEYHWNRKYHYPWIFFNDEPFDDNFIV